MNAYLTMIEGTRAGERIALSAGDNRIGRGLECQVVLSDPLTSRVHAVVRWEDDSWWVRDAGSRNGTYVNGQKIDDARLIDGCRIKLGTTEFQFHQTSNVDAVQAAHVTQTIVFDVPINPNDTGNFNLAELQKSGQAKELLSLHQLSIALLGCDDPDAVVRISLEKLHEWTGASVVGFWWVSEEGQLKPKQVLPEEAAGKVTLSETLNELVCQKKHAVRADSQSKESDAESLGHYADAICVPLVHDDATVGALHIYLEQGKFAESDFQLAVSSANIVVVALMRARRQALLTADNLRLASKSADTDELIGDSKPMGELKSKIARIARATGCVLVRGESGSGKELVARALHKSSARADRPMLSVNCAAIPAELMESQLFGHKKGAFTGADNDHIGWFSQADSGTLFLDEVGEMTLEGQAKLLRILEGHPFLPVGGTKEVSVDVRVIAATNRDLRDFVADKKFREDLYYRLSVFELYIPPLRDRGDDVGTLLDYFLGHFKAQHGRPNLQLDEKAREKLLAYRWPGNVRQLRNVIDSAVVMAEGDSIQPDDLGLRDAGSNQLESLRMDFWERKLIQEALQRTSGSVPEAAKLLGLGRATLYRKIEEYGIER
ncbi:MAG: sigma 54-interacting transcriptional regulator [Pirellulaceae bacterium]